MTIDQVIEQSKASIDKGDLRILLHFLSAKNPQNILEIGTWKGYSAENWIMALKPKNFITMDKEEAPKDSTRVVSTNTHYWWGCNSHDPYTLSTLNIYMPESIDFLFIDGDHSYRGVKKDWEIYSPKVNKGGVVVFHDIFSIKEVRKFWDEIKDKYDYFEIRSNEGMRSGMGVIIK